MALKAVLSEDEFNELDETTAQNYEYSNEDGGYVLSWDVIKDHPGVQKVKKTANTNKKSAEQVQQERDKLRKKFGPLVDSDDIDLSEFDEESLEPVLKYLRGETTEPPSAGNNGNQDSGKSKPNVDLEKVKQNARKPVERERDDYKAQAETLQQQLNNLVVDNALNAAVSEVQVPGVYAKAVKSMFKNMVKVDRDENGNPVALIEGEYGEQPVNKYLKDWAQTDEGKAFVEAPRNAGGGAAGGGGGSSKGPNPWMDGQVNLTEQARLSREEPEKAKRMAQAAGKKPPRV